MGWIGVDLIEAEEYGGEDVLSLGVNSKKVVAEAMFAYPLLFAWVIVIDEETIHFLFAEQ